MGTGMGVSDVVLCCVKSRVTNMLCNAVVGGDKVVLGLISITRSCSSQAVSSGARSVIFA